MLAMVGALDLQATSADRSVLEPLDFVREHATLTRDHIRAAGAGAQPVARMLDMSFASEDWRRAIRDRKHPGTFVRRHLEACVPTYLAEELRTGDIAVAGAQAYANWADQLLSPAKCAQLLPAFCAEAGLPADGAGFRADLQGRLSAQGADCDGGYPDNADLVIDDQGVPSLKRYRAAPPTPTALALEATIAERMPERTLLGIVARTGHWLEWWRRFGPASGSDPKLADAFFRYTLTTFAYGSNLGPAQAARHMAGVSAHELGVTARRHATIGKLNLAIADVVDAFSELDLARAWGDGATVAADGTQVETFIDNLLAETSIRYGNGRDRVPLHLRHLHRIVLQVHPGRGVGGRLPHRGPAAAGVEGQAGHGPRRHAGPCCYMDTSCPACPTGTRMRPVVRGSGGPDAEVSVRVRQQRGEEGFHRVDLLDEGGERVKVVSGFLRSWRPGIARPTRWSPTPTTFVTCGGSSTVTA